MGEFEDLQERVFALYADARFEQITDLLDGAAERFADHRSRVTFWIACVDSLLGRPERALEIPRRGAEAGTFWPEGEGRLDRGLPRIRTTCLASRR